jgi:hypothetical protein
MSISYQIHGLKEMIRRVDPAILARPLRRFFDRSTGVIERRGKQKAPRDTAHLQRTIVSDVDRSALPKWGRVGTNAPYAKPVEYGTGLLSEAPDSARRRYFPPGGPGTPLDVWARKHGFENGWQVARIIYRRGGTAPRRFLREALAESVSDIVGFARQLLNEVREEFSRR